MKLHRRHFLALSAASAGGILLPRCAFWHHPESLSTISAAAQTSALLSVYRSIDGLLEVSLEASDRAVQLGDRQAYLLNYNGQVPGPRLEAKPGDSVRIQLTNALAHPTNLHYHGLHIPPTGIGDNVFLSIPPNQRLTYEFTIPPNHPAGTFWYHPHHHGNVAEQVFGGLAGLFVVRGDLDAIPEVSAAQEEFLVLKDFDLNANGQRNPPYPMSQMRGREGALITVNGLVNPAFSIATGGLVRLRLLNASVSRFYRLRLDDHPLYLIATDGGAIAAPVELIELLLAPGERAEVLVKGDRPPGSYQLLNLPYDRGGSGMMGNPTNGGMGGMMHQNQGTASSAPTVLATLNYQGTTPTLALPTALMEVEALPNPNRTRRIELSMAMSMGMGSGMGSGMGHHIEFLFNGQPYDSQRIDAAVQLNTVEEWELVNVDTDRMDHPFHLHVNPFQVISRDGQPEPYRAWKDTVLVKGGETVRIRIPFRDFAGKTVYHCHILDHEDLGMMANVEIQDRDSSVKI